MMEQHQELRAPKTYRILIVDDNEAIHRDFRTLLQERPASSDLADLAMAIFGDHGTEAPALDLPIYTFDSAYQGASALETVKNASSTGQSYALAFVDVRMPPGWDGVETIQRIWEVDPNIQMVICSAYSDYTWDELVHTLGTTDKLLFLRKPFDPTCVKQIALAITCKWSREQATREHLTRLEALVSDSSKELAEVRGQLRQLAAEIAEVKTTQDTTTRQRSELASKLRALVEALESVPPAQLSKEQQEVLEAAIRSGRALLDDIAEGAPR